MDDEMEDSRLAALDGDLTDPSKLERDGTPSSIGSSPDQDLEQDRHKDSNAPPLKRKGGRKPIYATSEERKQRNRQAQAAFRERRTEYIKTLELQLKQNEEIALRPCSRIIVLQQMSA
ncbi:hypothetical protein AMS68_000971 [Peltaster fructicola]|uniref:BZIP domain-containing protein n=1 Tax=Peltaster fructicola TaxID=286661 RepID=A0A6H0XL50_9PEZI|nr:hypothetical protein AMS68_000971 [Peltaster fructicola]